jgi:glycosyltransferase involved in cell wall biosynthesis
MGFVPFTAALPIGFVMPAFDPGGTERQMIELLRRLDPSRWQVHVACLREQGAWLGRVVEAAASVTAFPVRSFKDPGTVSHMRAFARWCSDRRIAVVHTTDLPSNIFGLPAAAWAGVPVRIANRREINPGRTRAELAAQRAAYVCAHRIVANCRAAASQLEGERVPARKIAVVPNGVHRTPAQPREWRPHVRRVIVVANLRPEKGHDVFLTAAATVLRSCPDATFALVGGGPELGALRSQSEALGIAHAVTFHGHCDDVPRRLAAADMFVLPSRSEAFPNALLEAMTAGLPVVATGVGGVLELVAHERTGLLVPPGDPRALADQMQRLMRDTSLATRLGLAARVEVSTRYSFDRMVSSFESIYLAELGRSGVAVTPQSQLAVS